MRSPSAPIDYRASYRWTMVLVTVCFLLLLLRLFVLQILRVEEYQA